MQTSQKEKGKTYRSVQIYNLQNSTKAENVQHAEETPKVKGPIYKITQSNKKVQHSK